MDKLNKNECWRKKRFEKKEKLLAKIFKMMDVKSIWKQANMISILGEEK